MTDNVQIVFVRLENVKQEIDNWANEANAGPSREDQRSSMHKIIALKLPLQP